jgi:hypothetical protein
MRNNDVFGAIGVGLLITAAIVMLYVWGDSWATNRMRAEAVKHGKAEYFINTDTLEREWRWKP